MSKWSRNQAVIRRWRREIIMRDGLECAWCGKMTWLIDKDLGFLRKPVGSTKKQRMTLDHVLPRGLGGRDSTRNLICSCSRCNNHRGCLTIEDYIPLARSPRLEIIEKALERSIEFHITEPLV